MLFFDFLYDQYNFEDKTHNLNQGNSKYSLNNLTVKTSGLERLSSFIESYLEWETKKVDLSEILKDFGVLRYDYTSLSSKYKAHKLSHSLKEAAKSSLTLQKEKNSNIKKVNRNLVTKTPKRINDINFKSELKKKIAKGQISQVVDEIIEYGVENENDIIALASRWSSLQKKYHQGIMANNESTIENNSIVHALLNFIKDMKSVKVLNH